MSLTLAHEYAQEMERGRGFPPVEVVAENGNYWLWDGYHRKEAAELCQFSEIEANITEGVLEDAEWLALTANKTHGFRRSNEDKRRVIELAFSHTQGVNQSDNFIALHTGISQPTVSKIRHRLEMTYKLYKSEKRTGADGRTINTANIGSPKIKLPQDDNIAQALMPDVVELGLHDQRGKDLGELNKLDHEKQGQVLELMSAGEAESVTQAKRELNKLNKVEPPPIEGRYKVFYADPPWEYGNKGLDDYGHAERHYPTMTITELCALGDEIKMVAEQNAVLFLWVTSPLLEDGFKVLNAWGFKYKTSFVWDKIKHNFGHYNSVRHEFLLVCTKGSCTPEVQKLFDSVQSVERSDNHSEKPENFRAIIDTLYPSGNRIELFSRTQVDGWETWGNERNL